MARVLSRVYKASSLKLFAERKMVGPMETLKLLARLRRTEDRQEPNYSSMDWTATLPSYTPTSFGVSISQMMSGTGIPYSWCLLAIFAVKALICPFATL
jgi:hypothetical protein